MWITCQLEWGKQDNDPSIALPQQTLEIVCNEHYSVNFIILNILCCQHTWHLFQILLSHQMLYFHPQQLTCYNRHVIWHERHWQQQTPCATGHQPGCKGTPQCGPFGLWYDSEDAPRCAGHCSPAPGTWKIEAAADRLFATTTQGPLCIPCIVQTVLLH